MFIQKQLKVYYGIVISNKYLSNRKKTNYMGENDGRKMETTVLEQQ